MKNPKVSIIIPTYNEEEYIANCLISIQNQDFKNYEIIVVDNGSTDKTCEIVKLFREVIFFKQTDIKSAGSSKNLGAFESKGDILLFIDSDEVIGNGYIKKMIKPITSGKYRATVPFHNDNGIKIGFGSGIFRAIKRKYFKGFDIRKGYADDQVDYLNKKDILKVDIPLYHITSKTLKKSFYKGEWIGNSFEHNEKNSLGAKLVYRIGYIIGLFGRRR